MKFKAYANAPVGPVSVRLDVSFEGGYKNQRVFFAGAGLVGVEPPSLIVSAAKLLNVKLSSLVNVKVSASGSAGGGPPSLKVGGEIAVAQYPVPDFSCFGKCRRWFGGSIVSSVSSVAGKVVSTAGGIIKSVGDTAVCIANCHKNLITWKDFKIGATVTLLPTQGVSVTHRSGRYLSEPGIERSVTYVDMEGEQVPALVEFNYGRAIKVLPGNEQEVFSENELREDETPNRYYYYIEEDDYDYIMVRVKSETGVPQVKAIMSWAADEAETAIVYTSLVNTNPDAIDDDMVFSSSEEDHETLGMIKTPVSGFYVIEILNPDEVGNVEIEVVVPNQAPSLEITSVKLAGGTDTEDILEVTYTLTDPDTENPFVTFRLSDQPDKTDTALFLFPEGVSGDEADSEKLIGQATEKTVRLAVDRSVLKSDTYRLYGQAEDGAAAPVWYSGLRWE